MGQEAQIEITGFKDKTNNNIPGKITIIPANHKDFQEFMNYFTVSCFMIVRGSEISLNPKKHTFWINNTTEKTDIQTIQIKPVSLISTTKDDIEYGDAVPFTVTNDVFKSNKLFIKSKTQIFGVVDYLDENGWCGDNAVIHFKKFITTDVSGNKVVISYPLAIDGFDMIKFKSKRFPQLFNYCGVIFRGKEVDIKKTDKVQFNLLVR